MRVLIYTHNTMGLGHAARASALGESILTHIPDASILFVGGVNLDKLGWLPRGTDQLKLPSFTRRIQEGQLFTSPRLNGIDKSSLSTIRCEVLRTVFLTYNPEVVIVDFFPRGKMNELTPALTAWKSIQPKGLLCFGLRGVIDSPDRAFTEALDYSDLDALKDYDVIWAYCDPKVIDVRALHPELDAFMEKLVYTGYILRGKPVSISTAQTQRVALGVDNASVFVLVSLGFGWMSDKILPIVIEAIQQLAIDHPVRCLILCGDYLTAEARAQIDNIEKQKAEIFLTSRFVHDPLPYMQAADIFIGRGGYNTLANVISCGKPSVIIPSVADDKEQLIHAEAVSQLGFCNVISEEGVTPMMLAEELSQMLINWEPPRTLLDTNGADKVALWITHKMERMTI